MKRSLIWFRNDLRIHDNEALLKASQAEEILPVYCFDPRHFTKTAFGIPKTGSHRVKFLRESVINLKSNLQSLGGDLYIQFGRPETIIPKLVDRYSIDLVFTSKEITTEEVEAEEALKKQLGKKLSFVWQSTLFHINDIPFLKTKYLTYSRRIEKKLKKILRSEMNFQDQKR